MNEHKSRDGIGFFGLLGLLFIGLKLSGNINWSWWLVLLPIYGPLTIFICVFISMSIIGGLMIASVSWWDKFASKK